MRLRSLLVAGLLLAAVAPTAHADGPELSVPATCPAANGYGVFTPGISPTPRSNAYHIDVAMTCGVPVVEELGSDEDGRYDLILDVTTRTDYCRYGFGSGGTVSGSTPEGDVTSGSFTLVRHGLSIVVFGTFASGGELHRFDLALHITPARVDLGTGPRPVPGLPPVPQIHVDPDKTCVNGNAIDFALLNGHAVVHDPDDETSEITDLGGHAIPLIDAQVVQPVERVLPIG